MQSGSTPWNQSRLAVLLAAILFPPLGLVLVWKRPGTGLALKLLSTPGIVALGFVHLFLFWGLRMDLDGGVRPLLSFGDEEQHYEAIEEDRASQRQAPPELAAVAPPAMAQETETTADPAPAAYWTGFRGPNRDGHYQEMEILTTWPPAGLEELWRKPVGGGYASFSIAGGSAFTIEQRRDKEVVAAYDMESGFELWTDSWTARFSETLGGPGPRATPTWHEGRLYALGAAGEFRCLDAATGKVIWRKNILEDNGTSNLKWGMAASPLIVDDMVIVLPGGRQGNSVVAYDRISGDPVWRSLDDQQAYVSAMVATLAGRRQMVVVSASRVMGITVEEGKLLWEHPWVTNHGINVGQPLVVTGNRLFISAGYGHGAALLEITGSGDRLGAGVVWESGRMKNKFNSSALFDGHIYGLDERILACIDAATGRLKWKGGRYGYGQLLLASGHLIITTERGEVVLVKATPESHQELARFPALEGKTWNTPAIAGGKLLVRNAREMACYRLTR